MDLKYVLCYVLFTVTITCIHGQSQIEDLEERLPQRVLNKRIATLVVDDAGPALPRMFLPQPKVIYRRLSKKSYAPQRTTYGPKRTKYGPPRTLKKPGKKYRNKKGSKRVPIPYPYKKRAPNQRYAPRGGVKPMYGPPKKTRIYSGVGFGEPPVNYMHHIQRPQKPADSSLTLNREPYESLNLHDFDMENLDFSSPASVKDNFANKPGPLWAQQEYDSRSQQGYGEPPVDSYGAPVRANLHDLTHSTMQSYLETSSDLDEDQNFGPESRPWKNMKDEPDNNLAYSKKRPSIKESEDTDEVFVTPVPERQNEELNLNSYSDIYNYRQQQEKAKANKKKRKGVFQKNIKILNKPWLGSKMKKEIIVGGQYAEPPARQMGAFDGHQSFSILANDDSDTGLPISSYVNYKNSNMAFSPQNLNDAFSIVDK